MKGNPLYSLKVKEFGINQIFNGIQLKYYFKNGYAASVVCHQHSYGGEDGEFEVALMDHLDNLVYHEEVGVIGYLSFAQVEEELNLISELDNLPKVGTSKPATPLPCRRYGCDFRHPD
jgi:hypothetical protein